LPHRRPAASLAYYMGAAMARRGEVRVGELKSGSRIALDLSDFAHHHIYFFGTFEEPTTRFIQSIAKPGWTVVDVGANAGYFSLLARDLGGPRAVIRSFEPNPALADLLSRSIALNGADEVALERVACGAQEGQSKLYLSDDRTNSGLASLVPGGLAGQTSVDVPVVRLDAYCEAHSLDPMLVKIDVEGYEEQVLRGMSGLLERRVPSYLICEVGVGQTPPQRIIELMAGHRYAAHSIGPEGELVPARMGFGENLVFSYETGT
jgi:FkbM family methyltransferase